MSTRQAIDEADIRQQIGNLVEAVRAMDLEGLKSIYAPDVLSFDVEPPIQHIGAQAKWTNWANVFAAYRRPLGYELRDLAITVGADVAFGHSLNRISGTLKDGSHGSRWVRWTACFRKIGDDWLIVHDHISVPVDAPSGRALLDLEP